MLHTEMSCNITQYSIPSLISNVDLKRETVMCENRNFQNTDFENNGSSEGSTWFVKQPNKTKISVQFFGQKLSIRDFLYVEVFGSEIYEERSWSTVESTSNYVID